MNNEKKPLVVMADDHPDLQGEMNAAERNWNRVPEAGNPIIFIGFVLAVTWGVLIWLGLQTFFSYQYAKKEENRHLRIVALRGTIMYLDEVLTMSARMAATTSELHWEARYRRYEPQLDRAIQKAIQLSPAIRRDESAAKTHAANTALVEMENRAFDLVRNGHADKAKKVLFSDAYIAQKRIYADGMNEFYEGLSAAVKADLTYRRRRIWFGVLSVALLLPFLLVGWGVVFRAVNRWRATLLESNRCLAQRSADLAEKTNELYATNETLTTEIEERKRIEKALRESEKRFRELVEGFQAAIMVYDNRGEIVLRNQRAKVLFELPGSNSNGENNMEKPGPFFNEDGREVPVKEYPINRALKKKTPIDDCILGFHGPDGDELIWLFVNAIPVVAENGDLIEVIVSFVDITNLKRAEAERNKLQEQLRRAQRLEAIGQLAGGVAHDFNNMLGVILGYAEMALEKVDAAEPLHGDLSEIRKAAHSSTDLTRQLLAFARKQTVVPKVVGLNRIVEKILKLLRRLIGEGIDLVWHPGGNLWPVRVDPAQVDQVLINLCVNARDAITGTGKITIETGNVVFDADYCAGHAGFQTGAYVLLAVSDNGCGMDSQTSSRVFDPFFTTKKMGRGTGLGLASVYGAVKQNSGFVNVYSEPGQGTTFKIYLPRIAAEDMPEKEEDKPQAVPQGNETILLVEDEASILKMTTIMLERLGYHVFPVLTPGEAIHLVREQVGPIDLLITDVVMPEMNGRDLANRLVTLCPGIRVLFMSGYTANVIAHHGVLDQGVHFIHKPFTNQDLGAKIREALGASPLG